MRVSSRASDSEWQKRLCSPWPGSGAYDHKQGHMIQIAKTSITGATAAIGHDFGKEMLRGYMMPSSEGARRSR